MRIGNTDIDRTGMRCQNGVIARRREDRAGLRRQQCCSDILFRRQRDIAEPAVDDIDIDIVGRGQIGSTDRRLGGIQCSRDRDVAGGPAAAGILHVDRVADLAVVQRDIARIGQGAIGRQGQVTRSLGKCRDSDRTRGRRDKRLITGLDLDAAFVRRQGFGSRIMVRLDI